MAKILVGRDNPKEVDMGIMVSRVAQVEDVNVEAKEQPVEEPVKDIEPAVEAEAEKPGKAQTPVKGRGKKRAKA